MDFEIFGYSDPLGKGCYKELFETGSRRALGCRDSGFGPVHIRIVSKPLK